MVTENRWLKLSMVTDPCLVEPLADFLVGVLDAGVETGAVDDPLFGTVNAYIRQANPDQAMITATVSQLSAYLAELAEIFAVPAPELSWTLIEQEDWGRNWKAFFQPFTIVPGLVIAPTWSEYHPEPGEQVITMDPGMAFGTGHHATTCLCLEEICRRLPEYPGTRVLDVGTGTGILGMAAALFGAAQVTALDNDPEAVAAAAENVARNGLKTRMAVSADPLSGLGRGYQLVVANIVHDVLLVLADDLCRLTEMGGTLVLSGIMVGEQLENLEQAFIARGFGVLGRESRGEWAALSLKKPSGTPGS